MDQAEEPQLLMAQRRDLHRALVAAFPQVPDFLAMVGQCLGQDALNSTSAQGALNSIVFDVLTYAENRAVVGRLIRGALAAQPNDAALQVMAAVLETGARGESVGD